MISKPFFLDGIGLVRASLDECSLLQLSLQDEGEEVHGFHVIDVRQVSLYRRDCFRSRQIVWSPGNRVLPCFPILNTTELSFDICPIISGGFGRSNEQLYPVFGDTQELREDSNPNSGIWTLPEAVQICKAALKSETDTVFSPLLLQNSNFIGFQGAQLSLAKAPYPDDIDVDIRLFLEHRYGCEYELLFDSVRLKFAGWSHCKISHNIGPLSELTASDGSLSMKLNILSISSDLPCVSVNPVHNITMFLKVWLSTYVAPFKRQVVIDPSVSIRSLVKSWLAMGASENTQKRSLLVLLCDGHELKDWDLSLSSYCVTSYQTLNIVPLVVAKILNVLRPSPRGGSKTFFVANTSPRGGSNFLDNIANVNERQCQKPDARSGRTASKCGRLALPKPEAAEDPKKEDPMAEKRRS